MVKILILDDDKGMREFLEIMLTREGYDVTCAFDGEKALNLCRKTQFDLILTDLKMPKMDGIEFLKRVKDFCPEVLVILMTAYASGETAVSAMKEGAYDYIEKDFDIEDLTTLIREALNKKGIKKDDAQFIKEVEDAVCFGDMIGKSKEMLKVYSTINKVAGTMANILLLTLLYYANLQIESLAKLQQPIKVFMLLGFIPMLGSLITLLGTYQATNRYLRISLEDLY